MNGPILILGAGVGVGRRLRRRWPDAAAPPVLFHDHAGRGGCDLSGPIPALADRPGLRAGTVLVLAGVTAGDDAALAANAGCALEGLELARRIGARRVVLCSSAAVYAPVPGQGALAEAAAGQGALRPYGLAKLAMEHAAAEWFAEHPDGPDVTVLRLANIVGADMLARMAGQASVAKPLRLDRLASGGAPRRAYLTIAGLIRVLAALHGAPATGRFDVLNLAEAGPAVDMAALLDARAAAGRPVPWCWQPAPATALAELALDITRLSRLLPGLPGPAPGPEGLARDWLDAEPLA